MLLNRFIAPPAAGLMLFLAALTFGAGTPTHAQASDACPGASGTQVMFTLTDIPASRRDLLPSTHRSISILGLMAKSGNCAITITCVAESEARTDKQARDRQCNTVRNTVVRYETRSNVRRRLTKEINVVKLNRPSGGMHASHVYVTLTAL